MSGAARPVNPETLLAERAWVEALARRLVHDDATARDVVQETWLAAIKSPPERPGSLRGWLARVVRNAAYASHRRADRRARHEAAAPPRSAPESPSDAVARAEAHRRVVDAVMALEEPYRTAIVLRFFEGLDSDETAARTETPIETARTRVKRGLARLRERLGGDHGGDGKAWAIALLPLAYGGKGMAPGALSGGAAVATTKTLLAGAAAGALLATIVTREVMKGDEPPREVAAAMPAARLDPGAEGPPRAAPTARETRAADGASASATEPVTRSALAAAFDEVAIEPPVFVEGTISGRVVSKTGAGVAGVTVKVTPRGPGVSTWKPPGGREPTPDEAAIRDAVAWRKWYVATARETVTDASGAYVLTRLVAAKTFVRAEAPGWTIRFAPGSDDSNLAPGATCDFVATAAVEVPVAVVMGDTAPKENVLICFAPANGKGERSAWWSADRPVVTVEPGEWLVRAELGKDARSASVAVHAEVGTRCAPITLRLAERDLLTGVVRFDPADTGWTNVALSIHPKISGRSRDDRRASARAPDWRYRFDDLPAGEWVIEAGLDSRARLAAVTVTTTGGVTTQDISLPKLGPEDYVTVRARGPDGAPIPPDRLKLSLMGRGENGGYTSGGGTTCPQPDGSVRLTVGSFKGQPQYPRWSLVADTPGFAKAEVPFELGRTAEIDVVFGDPALAVPRWEGAVDEALATRLRAVLVPRGAGATIFAADSGIERPVSPGEYDAVVFVTGGTLPQSRAIARQPLVLVSGANPVGLRVPRLARFVLRAPGLPDDTELVAYPGRTPRLDFDPVPATVASGVAVFADMPPGLYAVRSKLTDVVPEMVVEVTGDLELDYRATPVIALRVTVEDAAGALAGAGFQTGDVVVSIDGRPVASSFSAALLFGASAGRERVTVAILRGGASRELTADPSKFGVRAHLGGFWEPMLR